MTSRDTILNILAGQPDNDLNDFLSYLTEDEQHDVWQEINQIRSE